MYHDIFCSCRATQWPFWFGFLLPFMLLYIFDWIMFIIILVSIMKHKRSQREGEKRNFKNYKENFVIVLSLSVVFGLGWGFGLLVTSIPELGVTITLQVPFSIFVGAQGALLFILHGIRSGDARDLWKQCCYKRKRFFSSKSTIKSSNEISTSHSIGMNAVPQKADLSNENKYDLIQKKEGSKLK